MAEAKGNGTGASTSTFDIESLHDRLDSLWATYLDLLDNYTTSQAAIKAHLSSGFFSLASANSKSSGTGRRYGQDYYDGRAVATTKVLIDGHGETLRSKILKSTPKSDDDDFEIIEKRDIVYEATTTGDKEGTSPHLPTPEATPEPGSISADKQESDAKSTAEDQSDPSPTSKTEIDLHDPLRWFGILLPPALRQAQKNFTSAVLEENAMTRAVTSARGMRDIEVEIRKLRKVIRKAEKAAEVADL